MSAIAALPDITAPYPTRTPENLQIVREARRKKGNIRFSTDLSQSREIAKVCFDAAMSLRGVVESTSDPEARARVALALKNLVSSWSEACERARIARGKPLPGNLRPELMPKRSGKKPIATFTEISPASPSGPVAQPKSEVLTASESANPKPPAS